MSDTKHDILVIVASLVCILGLSLAIGELLDVITGNDHLFVFVPETLPLLLWTYRLAAIGESAPGFLLAGVIMGRFLARMSLSRVILWIAFGGLCIGFFSVVRSPLPAQAPSQPIVLILIAQLFIHNAANAATMFLGSSLGRKVKPCITSASRPTL